MQEVNSAEEFNQIVSSNQMVLVDFWAPWCNPCKAMIPTLQALSEEYTNILFVKVNVDDHQDLARQYGIMSIPYLALFKDGKHVATSVGGKAKLALEDFLNNHV